MSSVISTLFISTMEDSSKKFYHKKLLTIINYLDFAFP